MKLEAKSYSISINQHCQFRHIETIEKGLKQYNELEHFRDSCFRCFLDFPRDMIFLSQLVYAVCAMEIVFEGVGKGQMFFGIDSGMKRFPEQDFCLYINLKFGKLLGIFNEDDQTLDGEVHDKYFGKGDVKANKFLERFQQAGFQKEGDAVKMILVSFVENILCSWDYRKKVSHWL